MKKISLFVLGILFCATNAWGDVTLPITYPASGTPMQPQSVSGVYSNVKYEIDVVTFNMQTWMALPVMGGAFPGGTTDIRVSGYTNASGNLTIQKTIDNISAGGMLSSINNTSCKLVKSIKDGAFVGFTGTLNLPDPGSDAAISISSFANVFGANSTATVIVPGGTKLKYVNAGWDGTKLTEEGQGQVIATEGDFGTNLHWEYDDDLKKLTITGTGTVIPDYVLAVANNAYVSTAPWKDWVNSIEMVLIADNVTTIGEGAFALCPNLDFLSLPTSLTSIGSYAFFNCSSLPDLTIAERVTSIGEKAFYNSSALSQLTIKSGNTLTIGANAFAINNGTASISITAEAETAPTIAATSFSNRKGVGGSLIVAVTVPSAAAKTAYETAWGTENFKFTVAAVTSGTCGTNLNWSYDNHVLTISGTGTTMTDYAYTQTIVGAQMVTTTDIPWTELKDDITSINITASDLQHIGNNAFRGCAITATPTFPSNLRTIGNYAFGDCTSLSSATIPADITSLGDGVFYNAYHLTSVTFEANSKLTAISDALFEYCAFEVITLPNGITSIGDYAFASNDELTSITIPATVASIGDGAFADSDNLTTFIFEGNTPPTVPYGNVFPDVATFVAPTAAVCDYANALGFYSTAGNAYIYKTSVDGDAVVCTPSGTCGEHLTWSVDPETFVFTIEGYGPMTEYAKSEDVPWIKAGIYRVITEVVLPEGLTTIGESAFLNHSNLRTVSLPSTLETIGGYAFSGCSKLKEMKVLATTPPTLSKQDFYGCTLYPIEGYLDISVPESALETYKQSWGESLPESSVSFLGSPITYPGCTMVYYPIASDKEDDVVAVCSDASADMTNEKLEVMADANNGAGTEIGQFTIARPIQANGNLNTICLPFALSAAQIANSDLAGATIYAFTAEDGVSEEKLLTLSPVTSMQAGVPYFFAYTNNAANTPNLSKLVFNDVLLTTAVEEPVDLDAGTFVLHGTLRPTRLNHASNYLFLGAENSLFYPQLEGTTEAEQTINPFRAYFEAKSSANHAPARFVFGRPMPTDVENVQGDKVQCTKVLENGKIIIIRNGEKYTIDGKQL